MDTTIIQAANDLTRRWVARLAADDTCISGPGAWLLLAALQSTAAGAAQRELATATGLADDESAAAAARLLSFLRQDPSVRLAAGVWARSDVHLRDGLGTALPGMHIAPLTDAKALDEWVSEQTDGLLTSAGVDVTDATALLLASALVADAEWQTPFEDAVDAWHDGSRCAWLTRTFRGLDEAAVLDGRVSRMLLTTEGRFDVHIVAGAPADAAADVLDVALRAVADPSLARTVDHVADGDGVGAFTVTTRPAASSTERLVGELPPFDITARHDLLAQADLFGLTAASTDGHHFPGLAEEELSVSDAVQSDRATLSRTKFRAAAVTAIGMRMTSALIMDEAPVLLARHDRPFGYLVVDRESGLVLFAGWVVTPGR